MFKAEIIIFEILFAQTKNQLNWKTIDKIRKERDGDYKIYLGKLLQDSINGIYIPKYLMDCFVQLDHILSANDKEAI